jgi:predicted DNA-binding transcriptional regulator AlpA
VDNIIPDVRLPDGTKYGYRPLEAVAATGASRSVLYEAMRAGRLPYRKLGAATVILRDDLLDWLRSLPEGGAS